VSSELYAKYVGPNWPQSKIDALVDLWDKGVSTRDIGYRIGASKNAVVGKAHRMDLLARPSPIRRDGVKAEAKPRIRLSERRSPTPRAPIIKARSGPPPQPVPPPRPTAPVYQRPPACCCWPIGEPGKREFRYCDAPSPPGKPYCPEHSKLAYVRSPKQDTAASV
jgi:GcrA cell cycle regulator